MCRPRRNRPLTQVAHEQIAARFFSLEEQEALAQVPDEERRAAFYNIWTRKEAYVKARGDGIAAGLGTFVVSLRAEAALLLSDEGGRGGAVEVSGLGTGGRIRGGVVRGWRWRP